MKIEYAIIIKDKTRLESLIEQFNTKAQAKFYIERLGGKFEDYVLEHNIFHDALDQLKRQISQLIKYKTIDRSFLHSYIFSKNQVIIVIGRDGLVANTAKYAGKVPIVAVNPDQDRYDGILLPFSPNNFANALGSVIERQFQSKTVRFAEARLNDGQSILAFNDLFIGVSSHVSARYKIQFNGNSEEHSSSGIIVSTQAGSTGWLSSIFNMAYSVTGMFEKNLKKRQPKLKGNQLLFAVREPFQSIRTQIGITTGIVHKKTPLIIESLMPTGGVIFSDGIESDFLKFNSGAIASIGISDRVANLVGKNN